VFVLNFRLKLIKFAQEFLPEFKHVCCTISFTSFFCFSLQILGLIPSNFQGKPCSAGLLRLADFWNIPLSGLSLHGQAF
jgi:hypothetical protein